MTEPKILDQQPHALYRLYGADDALLYVGISVHLARWAGHATDKPWWREVARATVEWFPDRSAALTAERAAIATERPRCNVQHNGGAPRPIASSESPTDTLVGSYFHGTHDRAWQGRVLESLGGGYFYVLTFCWMVGYPDTRHVVHIDDMREWQFYGTDEDMRDHYRESVKYRWERERKIAEGKDPDEDIYAELEKAFGESGRRVDLGPFLGS